MEKPDTGWIRSFVNSNDGTTIVELLAASLLGLMLLAMILTTMTANRSLYKKDVVRTRINQNLRGAMDIIGMNVRLAGENLGPNFPAVELSDGNNGQPDTLTLRRSLIAEVLPVCVALNQGSGNGLQFAVPGTQAGCIYSGQTTSYNSWRSYRVDHDGSVPAFIWNPSAKIGEVFTYQNEVDNGSSYTLLRQGQWQHSYPIGSAAYMLEEWRFDMVEDTLELIRNEDAANPIDIAFALSNFQVRILLTDGTSKTSFSVNDSWTKIQGVDVVVTGRETFSGRQIERSLTSRFFPRNVLSN